MVTTKKPDLRVLSAADPVDPEALPKARAPLQEIGDFQVPYGYEVWGDGLYVRTVAPDSEDEVESVQVPSIEATPSSRRRGILKQVAHEPIWIRRLGRAIDTGEHLAELAYRDAITGAIVGLWVDRQQIATKLLFVKLSRSGVPVNDNNVGAVMHYIDAALHVNGGRLECLLVQARAGANELPAATASAHAPAYDAGWGWLMGERWIGPAGSNVILDPRGSHSYLKGFMISGAEQPWFDAWARIASVGPVARWLLYSTFASPLLRFLKQRTFVIHTWGASRGGKSALAKFAMSAWGDPAMLTETFNRTVKSFTELFKYADDFPVLFDELQASDKPEALMQVIYALCLQRFRQRANTTGGLVDAAGDWHSVIRMTGEEPLGGRGAPSDLGGIATRVVQINTELMTSEQALSIHQWLERERHFGWGGLRFLEHLQRFLSEPPTPGGANGQVLLLYTFDALKAAILQQIPVSTAHRADVLAIVATAEYLANRWLFGADKDAAFEGAVEDAVATVRTTVVHDTKETVTDRAVQAILDHQVANNRLWLDMDSTDDVQLIEQRTYKQLFGVLAGPNEIWLAQRPVNEYLAKIGLPQRRVWADLRSAGLLVTPDAGLYSAVRCRGKFRARVYVLHRPRLEAGLHVTGDPGDGRMTNGSH